MLVFCHLFIGAVLGLFLYQATGKRWMVPVAAAGAMVPDLIDKPLGHLILQSTLDSGRIFGHSLLFLSLVVIAGLIIWKWRSSLAGLVLSAGMVSHLILDSMWENPTTVFWPLLGPFQAGHYPDYFGSSFIVEITSPTEWVFGIALVWVFLTLYKDDIFRPLDPLRKNLDPLSKPLLGAMIVLGIGYLIIGILDMINEPGAGTATLMLGVASLSGGAAMLSRYRDDPLV